MRTSGFLRASLLGAALGAALSASAQILLSPGASVAVPQTVTGSANDNAIASSFDVAFTGTDAFGATVFTGTLFSFVNRQADGTLAFSYFFKNTGTATMDPIERFNVSGFGGFTTSVAQGDPFGGLVPASGASRTLNGKVVSFNYGVGTTFGAVNPGEFSRFVRIYTNATTFTTGSAQFINGGIANVATFVPQAVPEPASFAALGVGAVALLRRRTRA